jgi:hypothetical protein
VGTAAPSDVTPESLLCVVFQEQGMAGDLKVVAREMLKRQPDNPDIQRLATAALSAPAVFGVWRQKCCGLPGRACVAAGSAE